MRNTWTFESWHPTIGGFGRWGMVMRFSLQWNVAGLAFPNLKCCRLDDETFWGLLFASSWCDLEGYWGCQHEHVLLIQCEIGTIYEPPAYRSAYIYLYRYQPGNSAGALLGMVKWHFPSLSDLQLGDKKVTLNHLEVVVSLILLFHCLNKCWWTYNMIHMSRVCKSSTKHSLQILYTKSIRPPNVAKNVNQQTSNCPRGLVQDVRLVRLVGQGSFGCVYFSLWSGAAVACKVGIKPEMGPHGSFSPKRKGDINCEDEHIYDLWLSINICLFIIFIYKFDKLYFYIIMPLVVFRHWQK